MADAALEINNENTDVLVRLVFAMENMGDRAASIEYLVRAIDLGYSPGKLRSFPDMEELLVEPEVTKRIEDTTASNEVGNQ
jgi:hypothetical protein